MIKEIIDFCGAELHYHGSSDREICTNMIRESVLCFLHVIFLVSNGSGISVVLWDGFL